MITTRFCSQCQQPLSVDAPAGLCPQCLMKAASGPPPTAAGDGLEAELIDIADPAEVAKKLPQFEILELLGRGGMGVVYKARQLNLDRIVALKILPPLDAQSPDFVARFTREARALAKLNHPNIVNVYDFGETGGLYWIIMEFVDGANLRQLFQTRKLTSAEALAIVPKICDALQYAHDEGLVHRDIKPENLLIDKKGRVKIADFGLAKLLRREPLDMTLTLSGMALGTLRYMAPEQMDKPETVDHRADLYSLGVVIYEMLTGETPVGRYELPSQKAQVDVRFDEIVLHALEREPDRRYQHASQVREDVEKVTSTVGAKAAATPASQSPNDAEDAGEDGEAEHSVFTAWGGRIIALAAVLLAFFNPWGPKAWYFFAACCAIFGVLASFGIGRRRTFPSQLPSTGTTGTTPADWQGKLQLAAIGLLLAGIADAVGGCIWIGSSVDALTDAMQHGAPLGWLIAKALSAVCGSFATVYYTIGSALFLLHRNDDGDITFPLVMAAIVPPGCVFGLPAAIYALVLLSKPEVKALFPLPSPGSGATPPANKIQSGAKNTTGKSRHLLSAFLVLLCLGGFFFGLSFQAKTGGTAAGVTEIITVGTIDPIFVKESGPSGFQTSLNFVSWSFFAVVVAGIALGALWRIGREDQGKVPRDPAWWRDWWKQVGIWGGLLLIVCVVRTVKDPSKVLQPPGDRSVSAKYNKQLAPASIPPLGTITNGIGAEFTVPAGQVAILEIVTRKDNATVPVPPHCAYVLAGETAVTGTFRWSREPEQPAAGLRRWRIEVVSGAGNGLTGGIALPEALDEAVGAIGLTLGVLDPNEETVHGEGLVALRVTTVAHNLKTSGEGIATTEWKGAKTKNEP